MVNGFMDTFVQNEREKLNVNLVRFILSQIKSFFQFVV